MINNIAITSNVLNADGVYMGPPFFALYGLMTNNQTLLQLAYDQVRLYVASESYAAALTLPLKDTVMLFAFLRAVRRVYSNILSMLLLLTGSTMIPEHG